MLAEAKAVLSLYPSDIIANIVSSSLCPIVSLMLSGSDGQQLQQCRGLIKEYRGPLLGAGKPSKESWKGTEGSGGC